MTTQRYTGLNSTKGITYYLDRIDKFIHLDFRPDSNRKLALQLKHVAKSLTASHGRASYGCASDTLNGHALIGVHVMEIHFIRMHLMGVYLINVHLTDVRLMSVHLTASTS